MLCVTVDELSTFSLGHLRYYLRISTNQNYQLSELPTQLKFKISWNSQLIGSCDMKDSELPIFRIANVWVRVRGYWHISAPPLPINFCPPL